jgi:hypothetical protein
MQRPMGAESYLSPGTSPQSGWPRAATDKFKLAGSADVRDPSLFPLTTVCQRPIASVNFVDANILAD